MRLGNYEVGPELGRGGMGTVLRGRAPDGRVVALKVLNRPTDPDAVGRFGRERRLLAGLSSTEGFVPLLDFGDSPRGPWLAMPFLGGGTLRSRLEGREPFPVDQAVALAVTLGHALGRAHACGAVHRDLKPENVLYTEDGRPLISDLGLAKHFRHDVPGASQSVALSRVEGMRGTVGYMPPEQMRDARLVGPPSDVFSLAAILYECLAGRPAFVGATISEVAVKVDQRILEPLRSIRPEVPRWLAALVERALSVEPGERFPDGEAFARALEDGPRAARARARRLVASGLLGAALLAGAGVGAARLLPAAGSPPASSGAPTVPAPPAPSPPVSRPAPKPGAWPVAFAGFASSARMKLERVLGRLEGHHALGIPALAVARDGGRILTGSLDGTAKLWDRESRSLIRSFRSTSVQAVDLSPGGDLVLLAPRGGGVELHDVATGRLARTLPAPGVTTAAAFAPDGKLVLVGNVEGELRVFPLAATEASRALEPVGHPVRSIAFLGPSRVAAVAGAAIQVLDLATGRPVLTLAGHPEGALALAATGDGRRLLSGGLDGKVALWDAGTGERLAELAGHEGAVRAVAVSPDGRRALSTGADRTLREWDLEARRELGARVCARSAGAAVAYVPPGALAATTSDDTDLRVWDLSARREVVPPGASGPTSSVVALAPFPEDDRVVAGSLDGTVTVLDPAALDRPRLLGAHDLAVHAVAVSPDGKRVLSAGDGLLLRLWEVGSGAHADVEGHAGGTCAVAFSPDGRAAASCERDGNVCLWWVQPFAFRRRKSIDRDTRALAFTPDSKSVLCGHRGLQLLEGLGDLVDGPVVPGAVTVLAWPRRSPATLYVGGPDGTIREVESPALATRRVLKGHEGEVTALALPPSGRRLASTSTDGTVRLWDPGPGVEQDRISLAAADDVPRSVAWSRDGRALWVGTARGLVLRYRVDGP